MKLLHVDYADIGLGFEVLLRDIALRLQKTELDQEVCFLYSMNGAIARDLASAGIRVFELGWKKLHLDPRGIGRFRTMVKEGNYDIVHVNGEVPVFFALASMKQNRPGIVYSEHAGRATVNPGAAGACRGRLLKILSILTYPCFVKYVDTVICISDFVAKEMSETFRIPPRKIRRIYNGVDVDVFDPERYADGREVLFPAFKNRLIFCCISRLSREKGVQNVIRLFSLLLSKHPGIALVIAGEGPYRSILARMVDDMGLNPSVLFLGWRQDIPRLLASVDFYCSLHEWREGFGISTIQAMAMKKAVIVSDRGASPEIVDSGKNGILVDIGDIPSLFSEVEPLIENAALRSACGNAARAKVLKEFNIRDTATSYLKAFSEVAKDRHSAA
jgi:glycosyltransferase involved in cell wall biosynthesis